LLRHDPAKAMGQVIYQSVRLRREGGGTITKASRRLHGGDCSSLFAGGYVRALYGGLCRKADIETLLVSGFGPAWGPLTG